VLGDGCKGGLRSSCLRPHPAPLPALSSLGDNYKDVLGIARDSPIYYQMKKVQKDLNEARETISRFGVPV
jgi:hypothetical protein